MRSRSRPETKRSGVFGKIPDRDRDCWVWSGPDWVPIGPGLNFPNTSDDRSKPPCAPEHPNTSHPNAPTDSIPELLLAPSSWTLHPLSGTYCTLCTILQWKVPHIHTSLNTSRSTRRSHDVPLAVSKAVAEKSGGDHTKRVLSLSSL